MGCSAQYCEMACRFLYFTFLFLFYSWKDGGTPNPNERWSQKDQYKVS